jgi:hypothetical protein
MGNATKFHPHTGAPIEPLWIRPDGRAMWPILGASPDDPSRRPTRPPDPADPPTRPAPPRPDPARRPGRRQGRQGRDPRRPRQASATSARSSSSKVTGQTPSSSRWTRSPRRSGSSRTRPARPGQARRADHRRAGQGAREAVQLAVYRTPAPSRPTPTSCSTRVVPRQPQGRRPDRRGRRHDAAIKTAVEANPKFKAPGTPPHRPSPAAPDPRRPQAPGPSARRSHSASPATADP